MKNYRIGLCLVLLFMALLAQAQIPQLVKINNHYTLMVDGKPYMMLGGQCGNSSNWPAALPEVWQTMEEMNANTLEIPIYWEEIEKVQGQYDFTSVQLLLDQARQHDIRLVLLWFATWKNGSNHYMPEWMKLKSKKYYNVVGKEGKLIDSPSPHATEAMELDAKAFREVMLYLKEHDSQHTVIMVQVQNEPGTWDSVRDYSQEAEKLFRQPVPEVLLKNKAVMKELGATATKGNWSEVFGARADEYFHAWYVASYIEYVAAAGKAVNPLPLYTNAALRNPLTNPMANEYESGGPTDNVICLYKAAAPSLDLVAPDIYLRGDAQYMGVLNLYTREDNALLVPETGGGYVKYLYEVLKRGIGFSPFGVDSNRERNKPLAAEYKLLKPIASQLAQWRAEGRIFSSYEPDEGEKEQVIDLGEWEAHLQFGASRNNAPLSGAGKAMIIKLGEGDFLCMGTEVRFSFRPLCKNKGRAWHYLRVEEGAYNEQGEWKMTRVLNGDQTDWGGPYVGAVPSMLRIRVYSREPRK